MINEIEQLNLHFFIEERSTDIEFVDFDDHDEVSDIGEGEILFKLRYPCIIRIVGFNLGDMTNPLSIFLSLEPNSIHNKEVDNHERSPKLNNS